MYPVRSKIIKANAVFLGAEFAPLNAVSYAQQLNNAQMRIADKIRAAKKHAKRGEDPLFDAWTREQNFDYSKGAVTVDQAAYATWLEKSRSNPKYAALWRDLENRNVAVLRLETQRDMMGQQFLQDL